MISPIDSIASVLRQNGQNITTPRTTVFMCLQEHGPIGFSELCTLLKETVDRASVYRTIALFERLGIVQRIHTGWKYKLELTDMFSPHHHHVTCSQCGEIHVLEEDHTIEEDIQRLARQLGFKPIRHQLEIQGICPACQQKNEPR